MWQTLWPVAATQTAERARREDPSRAGREALLLCASVVSLVAVGLVLVRAGHTTGLQKGLLAGDEHREHRSFLGRQPHGLYPALRELYYEPASGAVNFNEDEPPCYTDFAYLALTIGMTFQVSDTNLQTKAIRRSALGHALLSYAFGTLIIATTVNLVAGLST